MNERTDHAHTANSRAHTAHQTARLAELLDLLFEQARHDIPAPLVPAPQLRAMCVIDGQDHIPMRTLGRRLAAAPPSVCRLVDRLQALGFVQRHPHPDSGREVTLTLTPAGRAHLGRVRQRREHLLAEALDGLPAVEHSSLSTTLDTLHRALTGRPALRSVTPGPTLLPAAAHGPDGARTA
ncbi:MarR family winged helix-turn-helix transcriptional regulator [Streptomyces sp. NPDC091272]|uniref:MarR family winged helix-turn-helix transcriptional regulator n=1 Tax=Streptomyces sp. NPDC091272 TaxID=3365981 RepID=UPI00381A7BE6